MSILFRPDGSQETKFPANGSEWTLEELYDLIGTKVVEIVASNKPGYILIVDENGKLRHSPVNPIATELAKIPESEFIVGNAILCRTVEFK